MSAVDCCKKQCRTRGKASTEKERSKEKATEGPSSGANYLFTVMNLNLGGSDVGTYVDDNGEGEVKFWNRSIHHSMLELYRARYANLLSEFLVVYNYP